MPTLQDLPLELRQKIYSLALVEPRSIVIDPYNAANREIHDGVVRRDHHRNPQHRGQVYCRRAKKWVRVLTITHACLFRANKQTLAEAAPMFYGGNKFRLKNPQALERFLNQIGQNKKHLRHVGVEYCGSIHMQSASLRAFGALVAAKDFRSLHISYADFMGHGDRTRSPQVILPKVEALIKHCKPLLQHIKASYDAKSLRFNVMDVIQTSRLCYFCDEIFHPCYCSRRAHDDAAFREVERSVKKQIARQLKLNSSYT